MGYLTTPKLTPTMFVRLFLRLADSLIMQSPMPYLI